MHQRHELHEQAQRTGTLPLDNVESQELGATLDDSESGSKLSDMEYSESEIESDSD